MAGCTVCFLNKQKLTPWHFEKAQALKFVGIAATGTDNVDLEAAAAHGVAVANIRGYCSPAVAQHVFALALTLNQGIVGYDKLARSGQWTQSGLFSMFNFPIRELAGRNLGIVGFGALGRAVARVGEGFGMQILVSARPGSDEPAPEGRLPFSEVLAAADILSLHCPLTNETKDLLSAGEFRRMKSTSILVNTARGGLVDQQALVDALRAGEIAGAGIDVLPNEPPEPDAALLAADIPNLIVTPHIAWASIESRQRAIAQLGENVASFFDGGELRRVV